MTADEARTIALSLSEAVEQDHHGRPSFRVRGRIFATLWDPEHMNVMVDEGGILTAVQSRPEHLRRGVLGQAAGGGASGSGARGP